MHDRKNARRQFRRRGIAILLVGGLCQFSPILPRTVRAGDQCEAEPIAPELVRAIRDADAHAVRTLLENGANVNARDAEGNTPLIPASSYASPQCVALLLEKGAARTRRTRPA